MPPPDAVAGARAPGGSVRVVGVLLAAGASTRFGVANKLLATIDGAPLVQRAARALLAGGVTSLVVVTGHEAAAVGDALVDLPVRLVHNDDHAAGQGGSVAVGIGAVAAGADSDVDGALVTPADMPGLDAALVARLIAAFGANAEPRSIVCAATPDGEQRNPVVWPARLFPALTRLSGPSGGKAILAAQGAALLKVVVDDARRLADVDTPAELAAWLADRLPATG